MSDNVGSARPRNRRARVRGRSRSRSGRVTVSETGPGTHVEVAVEPPKSILKRKSVPPRKGSRVRSRARGRSRSTDPSLRREIQKIEAKISGPKVSDHASFTCVLGVIRGNDSRNDFVSRFHLSTNPLLLKPPGSRETPLSSKCMNYSLWKVKSLTIKLIPLGGSTLTGTIAVVSITESGSEANSLTLNGILARKVKREVSLGKHLSWKLSGRSFPGPRDGWYAMDTNEAPLQATGTWIDLHLYGQTYNLATTVASLPRYSGPLWQAQLQVAYDLATWEPKPKLGQMLTEHITPVLKLKTDSSKRLVLDVLQSGDGFNVNAATYESGDSGKPGQSLWALLDIGVGTASSLLPGPWGWLFQSGYLVLRRILGPGLNTTTSSFFIYPGMDAAQRDEPCINDSPITETQLPLGEVALQQLSTPNVVGGPSSTDVNDQPVTGKTFPLVNPRQHPIFWNGGDEPLTVRTFIEFNPLVFCVSGPTFCNFLRYPGPFRADMTLLATVSIKQGRPQKTDTWKVQSYISTSAPNFVDSGIQEIILIDKHGKYNCSVSGYGSWDQARTSGLAKLGLLGDASSLLALALEQTLPPDRPWWEVTAIALQHHTGGLTDFYRTRLETRRVLCLLTYTQHSYRFLPGFTADTDPAILFFCPQDGVAWCLCTPKRTFVTGNSPTWQLDSFDAKRRAVAATSYTPTGETQKTTRFPTDPTKYAGSTDPYIMFLCPCRSEDYSSDDESSDDGDLGFQCYIPSQGCGQPPTPIQSRSSSPCLSDDAGSDCSVVSAMSRDLTEAQLERLAQLMLSKMSVNPGPG
uniref:Capsid protein n=1 Tax=Guangdong chinese water snake astrovirus TaxID=2116148 RepID=A0A2P1GNR6_9VIRU|nr:capsid protein [Guangdong chinese water snake astrovirus]